MYNDVIKLKKKLVRPDGTEYTSERQVFCRISSIGTGEFYQAYSVGLKPEIKFSLPDYSDYNDEDRIEYNSAEYQVLRTYVNKNELEITCQAVIGGGY